MIEGISKNERKGIDEYRNKKWIWESIICCNALYDNLINNQDELPDVLYSELMEFMKKMLNIKYSLIELIGRDSK